MTGGVEITRNATKMARGLVSVQSRLNQITDENSSTGKALVAWYEEHGIKAFDEQTGQIRSLYDILTDVNKIWPQLTKNEQSYYLNQQAGANQTQNLAAILSNFDTVVNATSTSLNDSLGSAITENARYMESLEAQTNNLKAEFQDLANNVIDKELVSGALNIANTALGALNNTVGTTITQWGLLAGVLTGAITIFGAIATKIGAIVATGAPWAAIIAAAVVAFSKLYGHLNENNQSIDELNTKIGDNTTQLETNKARLEEINALGWQDVTPEILAEKESLEKENETLEKQTEKYQKLAEAKAQAILDGDSTFGSSSSGTRQQRGQRGSGKRVSEAELQAERMSKMYAELTEKLRNYQRILETNHELSAEQAEDYNSLVTQASKYTTAMENVKGGVASCTTEQQALYNQFQVTKTAYSDAQSYISTYVSGLIEQANKTKTAKDNLYDLAAQMAITNEQGLDFSQQIAALQALAIQAGIAADAIESITGVKYRSADAYKRQTGFVMANTGLSKEEAQKKILQDYWSKLSGGIADLNKVTSDGTGGTGTGGSGSGTSKAIKQAEEEAKDAVEEVKDDAQDAVEDVSSSVEDALNEQKQMMQSVIDYYVEYASRKIDEIQDQLDAINDKYDDMLDAAEERAQAQLDALEAENDAIEDQITLQDKLNALDKAKNTMQMVFKDGQFVYQADADEISKSQNELNAYYRQKDYENRKKYIEDSLAAEKEYIETLRKNETAALEEEKKRWEEYKEGWSNLVSEYEYQQNKLLADQMFGAEQENATWETRLANLSSFVSQYSALMSQLTALQSMGSGGLSGSGSGLSGTGGESDLSGELGRGNTWDMNELYNPIYDADVDYTEELRKAIAEGRGPDWVQGIAGQRNAKIKREGLEGKVEDTQTVWDRLVKEAGYTDGYNASLAGKTNSSSSSSSSTKSKSTTEIRGRKLRELERGYATGTMSARGGLSLVGEQGPEMRVLSQGDGIIPADVTRNLWSFGKNPAGFMQSIGNSTVLNISNVSLPSVRNANQFVDGLKELAIQRTYGNK